MGRHGAPWGAMAKGLLDRTPRRIHPLDKVVSFLKKCIYLVASKLSLEVVPFCKTQANSGDHSATMF